MTKTKKILIPIIAILVLASVVGIGFAAWLIVNPIDKTVDGGSFVANEVHDYTFDATAVATTAAPNNANTIIFGKTTETLTTNNGWLSAADVPNEVMSATITVTLDPKDDSLTVDNTTAAKLLNGNNLKVTVSYLASTTVTGATANDFSAAIGDGYLANPTLTIDKATDSNETAVGPTSGNWGDTNLFVELTPGDFKVADGGKTLTATITMTFAWGTNGNPYKYYNGLEYNDTNVGLAKTMLSAIRKLNEGKYQIKLQTVAHTAA